MKRLVMNQKICKGQALIEYSMILVLVVVVVILVLALFGPAIGKTYSNVVAGVDTVYAPTNTSAPPTAVPTSTPTPVPGWVFCADEHDYCHFSGTKEVRYGIDGDYTVRILSNGTWCTNAVFGDPHYGLFKHCYIR